MIALHVAALVLLLMPMSPPQSPRALDAIVQPFWIRPEVTPIVPPPPPQDPRIRPRTDTPPHPIRIEQPAIVVDDSQIQAPPPDPTPDTATITETIAPPPGPIAAVQLQYASAPPPPYPRDAQRRRLEGTVLLEVLVDVDGTPLDVRVQTSSGHRVLDEAAREHVLKRWRFQPAMHDGRAMQAVGIVPLKFTLQ